MGCTIVLLLVAKTLSETNSHYIDYLPIVVYFIVLLTDEEYKHIIDGSAQAEIQQFMSVDHSADEYAEVLAANTILQPLLYSLLVLQPFFTGRGKNNDKICALITSLSNC